jgi:hypothetical protein
MTESQISKSLSNLNSLLLDGKMMEAFEKYYHEDVEMQENLNAPTKGKAANRKRELEFLDNITEFRGASVSAQAVNDNTSFVVWNYDYTHKAWGQRKYTQVSVQSWQDGQIIREQFFYGN